MPVFAMTHRKAFLGLAAAAVVVGVAIASYGMRAGRHPDTYLIPSGYVGWLVIEHGVKGASPTPIEGGCLVYRFPETGSLKTSSPVEHGLQKPGTQDRFYYVVAGRLIPIPNSFGGEIKAPGVMIWQQGVSQIDYGKGDAIRTIEYSFIGTKSQFDKAGAGPPWPK